MYEMYFSNEKGEKGGGQCGDICKAIECGHFVREPGDNIVVPAIYDDYVSRHYSPEMQEVFGRSAIWGNLFMKEPLTGVMDLNGIVAQDLLNFLAIQTGYFVSEKVGKTVAKLLVASVEDSPTVLNKYDKILGRLMSRIHHDINHPDDNPESWASYGAWLHLMGSSMKHMTINSDPSVAITLVVWESSPEISEDEMKRLKIFEDFMASRE